MPASPRQPRRPGPASDYSEPSRSATGPPPAVPDAPHPISPVVTWSSTRTYVSSDESPSRRTSYSSYDVGPNHWAEYIFHGDKWRSRYRANQQL